MQNSKVTIIDYGAGNLLSLKRAFEFLESTVVITSDQKLISNSSRIILPGVGAFAKAMKSIRDLNLEETIISVAKKGVPFLGICLGMQLLLSESEEFGNTDGLNLIPGKVESINKISGGKENLKVPHIGWNTIQKSKNYKSLNQTLFNDLSADDSFYFVHSFASVPKNSENRLYDTIYEGVILSAVIGNNNIYGFQFHPEKSGKNGLKLLKKFLEI